MSQSLIILILGLAISTNLIAKDEKVNVMLCENGTCRVERMTPLEGDVKANKIIESTMIRALRMEGLKCEHKTAKKKNFTHYKVECFEALERTERYVVLIPESNESSHKLSRLFKNPVMSQMSDLFEAGQAAVEGKTAAMNLENLATNP